MIVWIGCGLTSNSEPLIFGGHVFRCDYQLRLDLKF